MHRVFVLLLAALDAFVAAAIGIAAALAPLAVVWFVAFGTGNASGLWPAASAIWQLGHAVPLQITLPVDYLAATGIDPGVAQFTLSLAPLGFAAFTLLFAARSGARAARAGAWVTGVLSGAVVFGGIAVLVALTGRADLAATELWQAILYPTAFYAVGVGAGAVRAAWSEGDDGVVDALRARVDEAPRAWPEVPGLVARGVAVAIAGLLGAGALAFAVSVVVRAPQIVALYQAGNVDALGAVVISLGQVLALPTLVVWALSFVAGPGFAIGVGTQVAPAGTQLGVLPGIPILGAVPQSTTPWLLALALVPVAVGALAGWVVRSRLTPRGAAGDAESAGVLVTLTLAIAAVSAALVALLCVLASGAIGPGRLAEVGPDAGAVALAIGIEIGVGAGILLLGPRARTRVD